MGHKGTSKRKPKKNKQIVTTNVNSNSPAQTLIQVKDAPIQNDNTNDNTKVSGGWNMKKKKRQISRTIME